MERERERVRVRQRPGERRGGGVADRSSRDARADATREVL
jgi:hypothetical protein